MKRLTLLLLALPLFAVPPTVTITGVDAISHSDARITFNTSGAYDHWQVRYIASPGTCTGGTGGTVIGDQATPPGNLTSGMRVLVTGATAGLTYNVCPEVHNSDGWSSGVSTAITFLALPNPHPALPTAPASFDTSYPDTSLCTVVTAASDCSDLNTRIATAQGIQGSTCTVIKIPAGAVCPAGNPSAAFTAGQVQFAVHAPDATSHAWRDSDVTPGTPGIIAFPLSTWTEGQIVTFGRQYSDGTTTPPASTSCNFANGFVEGGIYKIHIASVTSTQNVNVICGDGSNLTMAFSDAGATTKDLYFVPHVSASGNCPSTEGTTPCTFQRRPGLLPIIIRSSASDLQLPPEGVRMSEDYDSAGFLATLTVPVGNVNNNGSLAWFITGGQADGQDETMAGQIRIGPGIKIVNENDGSNRPYCNQFVTSTWNTDWIFDRDIFSSTGTPQRWGGSSCPNFTANGFNAAWINSLFLNMTNWDGGGSTTEGASGTITRGPGPVVFYNNRIEGAGVTIHFDDQGGTQFVRGDYSFIRNTLLAKEEWQLGSATSDGHHYYMRQPLEFKAGWRNLVCGNIFDRTWNEVTPTSLFLTLTSVNGEGITDTNICNNIFKHGPGGINIQLVGGNDPITIPPNRQMVYNNLFYDINGTYVATGGPAGRGWMFQGPGGGEDIIVDHNTFVGPTGSAPDIFRLQNYPVEGTLVASNFFYFDQSTQGMQMEGGLGTGTCTGLQAKALADCFFTPNYVFSKNVMGSVDSTQAQVITSWGSTPNFAPSSPASLTDINWLGLSDNNYRLSNTSSYRSGGASKGLDAQDVGANITMLERATGKVSGARVPENTITSTSAVIAFNAPDHQGCPVDVSTSAIPSSGVTPARFNDLGTVAGPRTVSATGLTAATLYHYRIQCAVEQPQGVFRTSNASVTVLLQTLSGCSTAGSGGNDTTCIQNAFTSTAGSLQILEMPAPSSGFYNVDPLTCVDHMNVLMDAGAHIKANTGISDGVAIINCDNHSNITFNGSPGSSSIEGRKSEYTSGESRHCIRFAGSTDVLFQGIACNNSGGDGIYIGEGTRGYALRIEVANALFDNNSRNGITIISCDTCNIHDTTSSNTKGENGAAPDGPYAGIDIEPNEAVGHVYSLDRLVNIQLINLTLSGNGVSTDHAASNGNGFTCHLDLLTAADSPANTSISGANITSINNVNSGFHITNEHDVVGNSGPGKPGGVALTSSHATGNGMYGTRAYFYDAGGPVFSYTSSVNTNNNMLGTTIDNTDMSVERGGGAVNDMGAIQWTGDSVISTNGNLQYYFDVEDFSSVGLSNITIDTFGTLSGATGGSNGLVNGSPATTVNIP